VELLRRHDDGAWQELWKALSRRARGLARQRLLRLGLSSHGAESVVVDAFASLDKRVRANKVRPDDTPTSLWPLLAKIVNRKAARRYERERAQKRDRDRVQREADAADPAQAPLAAAVSRELSPEAAAVRAEQLAEALEAVARDDTEGELLLRWMEGWSAEELAQELGLSTEFIELRLNTLWRRLKKYLEDLEGDGGD
jgi:RNA polymerase sigma factor (sigma-70 family)